MENLAVAVMQANNLAADSPESRSLMAYEDVALPSSVMPLSASHDATAHHSPSSG